MSVKPRSQDKVRVGMGMYMVGSKGDQRVQAGTIWQKMEDMFKAYVLQSVLPELV